MYLPVEWFDSIVEKAKDIATREREYQDSKPCLNCRPLYGVTPYPNCKESCTDYQKWLKW